MGEAAALGAAETKLPTIASEEDEDNGEEDENFEDDDPGAAAAAAEAADEPLTALNQLLEECSLIMQDGAYGQVNAILTKLEELAAKHKLFFGKFAGGWDVA